MIQELYQKAMKFAGEKHFEQLVQGTKANYLLHISNVAMEILVAYIENKDFDVNFAVQVAILHDTIEDTETTFEEICDEFGENVAIAVMALTKNSLLEKSEQITDSLLRINQLHKEVGMVKLADRITNLQTPPKHWTKEKIKKYKEDAVVIARELQNKNQYLNKRLFLKIEQY
jgi:guanosine-3',5'-bis(diphosphate) 3'-pyrophosphohydrolase